MPQKVTIDLPLVITRRGEHSLVRPIGFSEYAVASSKRESAVRNAKRRVAKACREYLGIHLVGRLIRGSVSTKSIAVEIAPPRKSNSWREPMDVYLDAFEWKQDEHLVVTYVPVLDLTVVASPGTDVAQLVQEQVRSAIRRADNWTLRGLAELDVFQSAEVLDQRFEVTLSTPVELARKADAKPTSKTPTLQKVATKLKVKSISRAFYREEEVELLGRMLSGRSPRSVLLVGPAGVGKTAVFHEWVRSRSRWNMKGVQCWATDGSRLISGQTGFGMWQEQCLAMASELSKYPSVVHLGNLVELSESGRLRGSGGCGSLLAPKLADGSILGIVEATPEQIAQIERTEPRLIAALSTLTIEQPTPEQTRSILLEAAASWKRVDVSEELRRKRKRKRAKSLSKQERKSAQKSEKKAEKKPPPLPPVVEPEALQMMDRLHRRFQTDAAAPGRTLAFFHAVMSEMGAGETLDAQKVIDAFGRQTGLPEFLIDDSVRPDLEGIHNKLSEQVLGQSEVITTLVDLVAILAADLSRGDRPLASLMLIGPTGVGKTETAKALSRLIYSDVSRMVRIDMSEYSGPSAVGRLVGDVANPDGLLTSAVRAQPFSLVLLDEFEKAHASVFDILLQVLGEGRLTDGSGRVADFRNSIVLMTSNLGVESFKSMPLGLADTQSSDRYRNHFERQVREFLRPEMFNRIDRILSYDPLPEDVVGQIAEMRIDDVQNRDGWKYRGNDFQISEKIVPVLARNGYQPQYGARPLAREVERALVVPLANSLCEIGRNNPVDVSVRVKEDAGDGQTSQVAVGAKVRQVKDYRLSEETRDLIAEMTLLRRRGQALDRSSAVRDLRNRITSLSRSWMRLKKQKRREAIRDSVRGRFYRQLRKQHKSILQLCDDLDQAESELLMEFHTDNRVDTGRAKETIQKLKERLWDALSALVTQRSSDNQRITLVMTGANLSLAESLLDAYVRLSRDRSWNLQVHAILPRDDDGDRVVTAEGWSEEPSFRIDTILPKGPKGDQAEDLLGGLSKVDLLSSLPDIGDLIGKFELESGRNEPSSPPKLEREKPKLAAYGLIQLSKINAFPNGTLGLMLTFGGRSTELMLAGEVGVHSFRSQEARPSNQSSSVLISKHTGTPIQYSAPAWLPERDFRQSGNPRRGYDVKKKVINDLTEDGTHNHKMDREGKWLEKVLEREMERRIWSALEE